MTEDNGAAETVETAENRPTPSPQKWSATLLIMIGVLVGAASVIILAVPFINASLVTDEDVRSAVRATMLSAQEEMAGPPYGPNEAFVSPFSDNPHRTDEGVMIAICFGPGNSSYTMTAWGIEGEYWNGSSETPGSIVGPETAAKCNPNAAP